MTSLLYAIGMGFLGLLYWAAAELPLVWRETALNTRKTEGGSPYNGLATLALLIKISAVLIWIGGGIVFIGGLVVTSQL